MLSIAFWRQLIPNLDRLLGWPEPGAKAEDYAVVPVLASVSKRLASRRRGWRAYSGGFHPSETLDFLAKSIGSTMLEWSGIADAKGEMNEETTKVYLIDPVLNLLGWHNIPDWHGLSYEYRLSNNLRPDAFINGVGMEFKKNDPLFDQLDANNKSNNGYGTNAQQCEAYDKALEVNCVIYSNGRFWWRVERDEDTNEFCALRFNMHAALNNYRNRMLLAQAYNNGSPYRSLELGRFVSIFHANAFLGGNNYTESVHLGMQRANYGGVGPFWLKDLNQGYGG